jgi:hypothetical protein
MGGVANWNVRHNCIASGRIHQTRIDSTATEAVSNKAALERTVGGFRGFISCLPGAKERGVVYGTGAWNAGDIRGNRAMKQAYGMGKAS